MEKNTNLNKNSEDSNPEKGRILEINSSIEQLKIEKKQQKNRTDRDKKDEEIRELEKEKEKLLKTDANTEKGEKRQSIPEIEGKDPLIEEQSVVFEQTHLQGLKYGSCEKDPNRKIINFEEIRNKKSKNNMNQKKTYEFKTGDTVEFTKNGKIKLEEKDGTKNSENNLNNELLKNIAYNFINGFLSNKEQEIFDKNKEKIKKIIEGITNPITENDWNNFVNKNEVSEKILKNIAEKIKNGENFSERETDIYAQKGKEIEEIIKRMQSSEKKFDFKKDIEKLENKLREIDNKKNPTKEDELEYSKIETEIKKLKGESTPKTDTEKIKEVKEKIEKEAEKVTSTDKEKEGTLLSEQLNKARELYAEGYKNFIAGKKKDANFFTNISRKVFGHTFKESEIPAELKKLETEYNSMIVQYGNKMYEDKKTELAKSGKTTEEQEAELKHFKNQDIFSKIIVDEQQKLNEAKADNLPPKEKAMWKKGLEWYSKQPKWKKIAISSALSISLFWAFAPGTVAAGGGILAYAGTRLGRSIIGSTAGQLAAKLYDVSIKERYTEKKEGALEKLSANFKENMSDEEILQYKKEYQQIVEQELKEKRNRILHKAMVTTVAGGLASFGAGKLAHGVSAEHLMDGENKVNLHNQPPTEDQFFKTPAFKGEQVEFNSKGAIQTIEDLKEKLSHQYGGDITKAPHSVQEFLKTNSAQEAIKLGFFNPNDPSGAESAMLIKGSTLEFDNKGNLLLHDIKTGETHTLITEQGNIETVDKYHGKMFDSDHSKEAELESLKEKSVTSGEGLNKIKSLEVDKNGNIVESTNTLREEDMPYEKGGNVSDLNNKNEPIIDHSQEKSFAEDNNNAHKINSHDITNKENTKLDENQLLEKKESLVENTNNLKVYNFEDLTESGKEVYKDNIHKMFPTEESLKTWEQIKNSTSLSAEKVMHMEVDPQYRALVLELKKLQEVTELDPITRTIGPSETLNEFMMRTMAKAGDLGRLDEVKFDADQLLDQKVNLEDNQQKIETPSNEKVGEVVQNVKENVIHKDILTIPKNEDFKFIPESFKAKFTYDAAGNPFRVSSNGDLGGGFGNTELLKDNYSGFVNGWVLENNRDLTTEISKVSSSVNALYKDLAIYESISDNPNYVKEVAYLKDKIEDEIKRFSKYGDIVDLEKLPKEFRGK